MNGLESLLIGTGAALQPRAIAVDPLTGALRAELLVAAPSTLKNVYVS